MALLLPLPEYVFMIWCLVKHRDEFTFSFTFIIILIGGVKSIYADAQGNVLVTARSVSLKETKWEWRLFCLHIRDNP